MQNTNMLTNPWANTQRRQRWFHGFGNLVTSDVTVMNISCTSWMSWKDQKKICMGLTTLPTLAATWLFDQGCTNPSFQVAVANEVCTVVPHIFWLWVQKLLHVILLVPRIVRWLLDFWKICAPLPWTSPPHICHLSPIEHAWDKVQCFIRSSNVAEAFCLKCVCRLTDATISWTSEGECQGYCLPSEDSLGSI